MKLKALLLACVASFVLLLATNANPEDDYSYTISGGTATIRGYSGPGGDVVIPSSLGGYPVRAIEGSAGGAFQGNQSLTSVVIPSSVTSIGTSVFQDCANLASVVIPSSVTSIGRSAFQNCVSLTSMEISHAVSSLGWQVFSGCTGLTSIDVAPANPNFVSVSGVLYNAAMTTLVQYPAGNPAGAYDLLASTTSIREFAFEGSVNLTSVNIPASVTSIGSGVFVDCTGLTNIHVDPANSAFTSVAGVLFDADLTILYNYPAGRTASTFDIPDGVAVLWVAAFQGSAALTSVSIPDSVTYIGPWAFRDCTSLASVVIPGNVTVIESGAFENCTGLIEVNIPGSVTTIGSMAFWGCTSLTSLEIPGSVTTIPFGAFQNCTSLTSVSLGAGITSIGNLAFDGCSSLTSLDIPAGVTSIGAWAFRDCTSLVSVSLPGSVTSIATGAFLGCTGLTSIDVAPGNSSFSTVSGVLFNANLTTIIRYPAGRPDSSYDIPGSVSSIGHAAFEGSANLTRMDIPNTVTSIATAAFMDCTSLAGVTIPGSVASINASTFRGCTSLTGIHIPQSVTSIANSAFRDCTSLTGAAFRGNAPSMGTDVFAGAAPDFAVFYFGWATGFTSPTWHGYPAVNLGLLTPFTDWVVTANVLSANYTGPTDDLNQDGVSLLMAYALDLDPRENLRAHMPQAAHSAGQLSMTFRGDRSGVIYTVETCTDLINWSPSGVVLSEPDADGMRTAVVEVNDDDTGFLRLVVENSAP